MIATEFRLNNLNEAREEFKKIRFKLYKRHDAQKNTLDSKA